MTCKFDLVVPGDTLYDVRRQHGKKVWYAVKVISMDSVTETAVVSWNGNKAETTDRKQLERYSRRKPA